VADASKDPIPQRPAGDGPSWRWRFEVPPSAEPDSYPEEEAVGTAWLRLQLVHTGYRLIDPKDYREISSKLEALERLFLAHEKLESYYLQCFAPEDESKPLTGPTAELMDSAEFRHVAAIQVQFLEDLFYALDLDRYANAPDNRGWMNLFRRWGRSRSFNHRLDELRSTLTLGFLEFYDLYLRYHTCRIDEKPVPHPWDSVSRRHDYRWGSDKFEAPPPTGGEPGPCEDTPKGKLTDETGPVFPGLFLDSGIQEVEEWSPTDPRARSGPGLGTAGGGQEGQADTKGGLERSGGATSSDAAGGADAASGGDAEPK
jgi:hypothetical protein